MNKKDMVYVAVKPETPDSAYALCIDHPEWKDITAASLSEWIKEGAQVMRVTDAVGWQMFDKYLASRPKQESLSYENQS